MARKLILFSVFITQFYSCYQSFIFHENTNIMFVPEQIGLSNEYFGYSISLNRDGLLVGAPKAMNRMRVASGVVFSCPLANLNVKRVICRQLGSKASGNKVLLPYDLESDVWFGASIGVLTNDRLIITAPRTKSPYDSKNILLHGVNYILTPKRCKTLDPLSDAGARISYQAFETDGRRREYGMSKTHIYYYAHGQVGFSMTITKMNTVIFGTPGLLQWTGGIVTYTFNPNDTTPFTNLQPITNTYNTMDLEPDDYFGYSVESGTFERYGSVFYVGGAPRSNMASGKVLIFVPPTEEAKPLDIKVKLMGPQPGSYFGASLCCTDINGDGLDDLLVGAPMFIEDNGALPYDQGAVFIYITRESSTGYVLVESGYVSGSGAVGARFGTAIADLGDVNGDGFTDIAIGAPWEDSGTGAVYVYMGKADGLNKDNVQKIQPPNARGFGWSISKGFDIDYNYCNDLAVGAFNSESSYLYRCIPTMLVHAKIKLWDAINLPHNVTTFTAMFCVSAPAIKFSPDVKLNLLGKINVDVEENRAKIVEDSKYTITVTPASETCDEKTINVNLTADLLKPMLLTFELEPDELMKDNSTSFYLDAARLSDASSLKDSFSVQLMRDCGDDLLCRPWLNTTLEALDNPYIPGTDKKFGIRLTLLNKEEPGYGLKVNITVPMIPKRIPSDCSFENFTMICDCPQPFSRNEIIVWEIELEYNLNITKDIQLKATSEVSDKFFRNITEDLIKELIIKVTPEADFSISGKAMPNASMIVLREKLDAGADVIFKHYFEITNLGPSDWPSLIVFIRIPEKTNLSAPMKGCEDISFGYKCIWSIPAKVSFPMYIPLLIDLEMQGNFLKENITYNATSLIIIQAKSHTKVFNITTTIILEPASIIWYIIIPCIFIGLLLLGIIVTILHKRGFFLRKEHEMVQREKEALLLQESESSSSNICAEGDETNTNDYEEILFN